MKLTRDNRAVQTLWWAVVFATMVVPLFALAMELGRYAFARAEMGKAADAAAVAAVTEVDYPSYYSTGNITLTGNAYSVAQQYASMNTGYLGKYNIHPYVSGIQVNNNDKTVLVRLSANVSALFPEFFGTIVVSEVGTAQVRGFRR